VTVSVNTLRSVVTYVAKPHHDEKIVHSPDLSASPTVLYSWTVSWQGRLVISCHIWHLRSEYS